MDYDKSQMVFNILITQISIAFLGTIMYVEKLLVFGDLSCCMFMECREPDQIAFMVNPSHQTF